ncbi:MAG: hypothetical protein WC091_03950 [Sulfuricellaceae bacterium]
MGDDAAADQFGYRLAAVVEVADALPVDGFFYPPPKQFKGADLGCRNLLFFDEKTVLFFGFSQLTD